MRCRKTRPEDLPQLKALWKAGFGDTDEDIDRFFTVAYPHCLGYCAEEGSLLAALYALPQTLVLGERQEKAAYLYAVTTAPEARGQGVCRALMAYAEKELRKKWFTCTLLVPGEPSLFGFYEKLGYRAQRTHEIRALQQLPEPCGTAEPLTLAAYAGLRETLLYTSAHVRYDAHWLCYAGTEFYALRLGGRTGCAAVRAGNDGACVCELLPDGNMLPALSNVLGQQPARIRAPGGTQAFAMLKWLDAAKPVPEPVYLAFAFE